MRAFVAVGGIYVPDHAIQGITTKVERLCAEYGFPEGEEFKWSPNRKLWMHQGLIGRDRERFFFDVLDACVTFGTQATVCIVDRHAQPATAAASPEQDATCLLLERVNAAAPASSGVVMIMDQPGGSSKDERRLADHYKALLRTGSKYCKFERIVEAPMFTESHNHRLLQVADLVTSCVASVVAGSTEVVAQTTFAAVRPLLRRSEFGVVGGVGLKLHPDGRYANLYHWLAGDERFWKAGLGRALPMSGMLYADAPGVDPSLPQHAPTPLHSVS